MKQKPKKDDPKPKPLSPAQAAYQLRKLDEMYEKYLEITPEDRDRLQKQIIGRLLGKK